MADWNDLSQDHVLHQFAQQVDQITTEAEHSEMYGVTVQPTKEGAKPNHTTLIILQKLLRANAGDLSKAKTQLLEALKWRKEYRPLEARDEIFSKDKFGGLGYVTRLKGVVETANEEDVATFNIYGAAAKDPKKTFGNVDAFIRWRVALMELTLYRLALNSATFSIPDYGLGPDPYQASQIHDYLSVSFFRQPAEVKASSSRIISLFSKYYPETVSYKYFVNVPIVMQWMMGTMKMLLSSDAVRKMTWMTYGSELVRYLGDRVGKESGGKGLSPGEVGQTVRYDAGNDVKKS
ncbi:Non-classical phosphatidylinositol transfer protein (PITP) [Oleoguttula sp. CCFEE 5521]